LRALRLRRLYLSEFLRDQQLGIATVGPRFTSTADPADRNARYEPLGYAGLRKISKRLPLGPADVFYDLGCGMGRMTCYFALQPMKRCVGIELDPELSERARMNGVALFDRKTTIDILTGDASEAHYSDATIVAMYNPFGEAVVRKVLAELCESLRTHPRSLRILYANPVHSKVFESFPQFREVDHFLIPYYLGRMQVIVWTNC
jgi:SAM-dependent methyltransferase